MRKAFKRNYELLHLPLRLKEAGVVSTRCMGLSGGAIWKDGQV